MSSHEGLERLPRRRRDWPEALWLAAPQGSRARGGCRLPWATALVVPRINAGVMLLNLIGLRRTYAAFADWTFSDANVRRGLHFGKFGPGDQGAYAEFYEGAFAVVRSPSFNWRFSSKNIRW